MFRLTEHIERLFNSAQIMMMEIPYTVDELVTATKDDGARRPGLPSCYIRPIAYYGYGEMGLNTLPCTVDVSIACWPWGAYLGDDAVTKGVRMKISSWTRHDHNTMPPRVEDDRQLRELVAGQGRGAEGRLRRGDHAQPRRARVGVHRREHLRARATACSSRRRSRPARCAGITQDSVTTIARDHGFEVRVDNLSRSDLYIAEEMFVCGTAAEVSAVNSVDDRAIPCPGPMTKAIADEYAKAVRGQVDKYKDWCELV